MRLAVSNLAFPAFNHLELLPRVAELGLRGVEVAPFHTFSTLKNGEALSRAVSEYWAAAFSSGLQVIGLRGLTQGAFDVEQLVIGTLRRKRLEEIVLLSSICRDLGGKTLVLPARTRGGLLEASAQEVLREFLEELLPKIEKHETVICLSPLMPGEGDFLYTANDCNNLALHLDHPSLGVELSSAALTAGDGLPTLKGRVGHTIFSLCEHQLHLFRIDEPGRAVIGSTDAIDHVDFRLHLLAAEYEGWLPILQETPPGSSPIAALKQAYDFIQAAYFPPREERPSRARNNDDALGMGAVPGTDSQGRRMTRRTM